jgi:hypothetical protein
LSDPKLASEHFSDTYTYDFDLKVCPSSVLTDFFACPLSVRRKNVVLLMHSFVGILMYHCLVVIELVVVVAAAPQLDN